MPFANPFNRIRNFDDRGYLRVNINKFHDLENRPQQFYDAITQLQHQREALIIAYEGGLLDQLASGFNFYKHALDWLRLNSPINQGIAVSAITTYEDINESIAQSFNQYVQWLRNNYLANQQIYQNIQIQIGRDKLDALSSLELKAEGIADDFKETLHSSQAKLSESVDKQYRELLDNLNNQFNTQSQLLSQSRLDAINQIQQAQSLTIWHEAYVENIGRYDQKLNGEKWQSLEWQKRFLNFLNRLSSDMRKRKQYTQDKKISLLDKKANRKELAFLWYSSSRTARFSYMLTNRMARFLLSRLVTSAKAQRSIWFTILGAVLIGQSLVFLAYLLKGSMNDIPLTAFLDGTLLPTLANNEYIFAKVSIFIGMVLVPSLGYAFASRNYRIYSNLLEQYRHRATVAQTLQGIIRYIDENEDNKDIRMSLATVAAVAMFEMKNVGHLSKRDNDTLPLGELIQGVLKK